MKIEKLNYTQIPNSILDGMAELSDIELRVLLVICRKTIGWRKETDRISHSQLCKITGLSVNAVKKARDGLAGKGLIVCQRKQEPGKNSETWYDLCMSPDDTLLSEIVSPGDIVNDKTLSPGDTTKESNINKINIKKDTPTAIIEKPLPVLINLCDKINYLPRDKTVFGREMKAAKEILALTTDLLEHYGGNDVMGTLEYIVGAAVKMKSAGHWYLKCKPIKPSTLRYCFDEITTAIVDEKKRREEDELSRINHDALKIRAPA